MTSSSTLLVISFAVVSVVCLDFGDDIYPCNIHTDFTPTVWAPTGTYTPPTTTFGSTTSSTEAPWGEVRLVGGAGPHEGNVMINYNGLFGAILSCEENR